MEIMPWQRALAHTLCCALNEWRTEVASKVYYTLDIPQQALLYMVLMSLDGALFRGFKLMKVLGLQTGLGFCRVRYMKEKVGNILVKPFLLDIDLCRMIFSGFSKGDVMAFELMPEVRIRRLHLLGRVPVPPQARVPPPYSARDLLPTMPVSTTITETPWEQFLKSYRRRFDCDDICKNMLNSARAAEHHLFVLKDFEGASMRFRAAFESQQIQELRDDTHSGQICDEALCTIAKVAAALP